MFTHAHYVDSIDSIFATQKALDKKILKENQQSLFYVSTSITKSNSNIHNSKTTRHFDPPNKNLIVYIRPKLLIDRN